MNSLDLSFASGFLEQIDDLSCLFNIENWLSISSRFRYGNKIASMVLSSSNFVGLDDN